MHLCKYLHITTIFTASQAFAKFAVVQNELIRHSVTLTFRSRIKRFCMPTERRKRVEYLRPVFHTHTRMLHQKIPVILRIRQVNYI